MDLFEFNDYISSLVEKVENSERLNEEDINKLRKAVEIRRVYSNAGIRSYYAYKKSYTGMELPEKTEILFESLNKLGREFK